MHNNPSESLRLEALRSYNILDSFNEQDYDDITNLASAICDVPVALISFVDQDRQWFKSRKGVEILETHRDYSFCSHAILAPDELLVVSDSRLDKRFSDNPFVTDDPNIVFYAGAPLVTEDGFGLGTVCVIDIKPRTLTTEQATALKTLSKHVMHLLALRKKNYELQLLKLELELRNKDLEQFAMVVSHDIKSPLTAILLSNNILESVYAEKLGAAGLSTINTSTNSARKIKEMVDGILAYYKSGMDEKYFTSFDLADFINSIAATIVSPKPYKIVYEAGSQLIYMHRVQLEQIFINLVNNSIRYNDKAVAEINISFSQDEAHYYFSVQDNGIGIAEKDYDNIFNLFTTLSLSDSFGIKGHGIGLPTVKKMVENYDGSIRIKSVLGEGSTFTFQLKKFMPPSE